MMDTIGVLLIGWNIGVAGAFWWFYRCEGRLPKVVPPPKQVAEEPAPEPEKDEGSGGPDG